MKKFFKKIGAFFKHVWTKYRDNWFKITFYCLLVFIMSCAWFRSCKEDNKPQATLTASADEVTQPVQRSEDINYTDYAFNIFPYPYTVDLTGTPLENIVTFGADGSIVLNGTFSAEDYNSSDSYGIRFAVINDTNSQLVGGRRYYYKSVPQIANQLAGIITNYRPGGIYTGYFDYVAGTDVYFTLRVTANTYDNFVISPALYYTDATGLPWTPPISILLDQTYNDGYGSGFNAGADYGYDNGYEVGYNAGFNAGKQQGINETTRDYQLGIFKNARVDYTLFFDDNITETGYAVGLLNPTTEVTGVELGKFIYDSNDLLVDWRTFNSATITFTFDSVAYPNGIALDLNLLCLTFADSISDIYLLPDYTDNWDNGRIDYDNSYWNNGKLIMPSSYQTIPSDYRVRAIRFNFTNAGDNLNNLYLYTPYSSYADGYNDGFAVAKKLAGDSYIKGYNAGYNKGREVDSQGYTFLSLIDAVGYGVTKPFVSILNFDLLGMNMLSFVTGLLTLVLIVKLCSMFI